MNFPQNIGGKNCIDADNIYNVFKNNLEIEKLMLDTNCCSIKCWIKMIEKINYMKSFIDKHPSHLSPLFRSMTRNNPDVYSIYEMGKQMNFFFLKI